MQTHVVNMDEQSGGSNYFLVATQLLAGAPLNYVGPRQVFENIVEQCHDDLYATFSEKDLESVRMPQGTDIRNLAIEYKHTGRFHAPGINHLSKEHPARNVYEHLYVTLENILNAMCQTTLVDAVVKEYILEEESMVEAKLVGLDPKTGCKYFLVKLPEELVSIGSKLRGKSHIATLEEYQEWSEGKHQLPWTNTKPYFKKSKPVAEHNSNIQR